MRAPRVAFFIRPPSYRKTAVNTELTLVPLINLPFLASEVNDAHKQVKFHGKSMLLEAKRAGEALLAAKQMVKHGEFKAWVEANCRCSYRSAVRYMQIAKIKDATHGTFERGINAFLEAHATPRTEKARVRASFSNAEAEYTMKLQRMAESTSQHEAAIAGRKLDQFASDHGMNWLPSLARRLVSLRIFRIPMSLRDRWRRPLGVSWNPTGRCQRTVSLMFS
jgi:hypothetical protein